VQEREGVGGRERGNLEKRVKRVCSNERVREGRGCTYIPYQTPFWVGLMG